jgi:hypothetical protein
MENFVDEKDAPTILELNVNDAAIGWEKKMTATCSSDQLSRQQYFR